MAEADAEFSVHAAKQRAMLSLRDSRCGKPRFTTLYRQLCGLGKARRLIGDPMAPASLASNERPFEMKNIRISSRFAHWLHFALLLPILMSQAATSPFDAFITSGNGSTPLAIAVDDEQSVFVSGRLLSTNASPVTREEHFLIKYAPDLTVAWAKSAGDAAGASVATDRNGHIYVTGTVGVQNFSSNPLPNGTAFVAKYQTSGELVWIRGGFGPDGYGMGRGLAIDPEGNVYVAGNFTFLLRFGETSLISDGDRSAGYSSIFIAKYTPSGELRWVRKVGGKGTAVPAGVSYDVNSGRIAVGGTFDRHVGGAYPVSLGEETATIGWGSIFFATVSPEGVIETSHVIPATSFPGPGCVTFHPSGDILLTGSAGLTGDPSIGIDGTHVLPRSIFVARYGVSGEQRWLRSIGGQAPLAGGQDYPFGLTTDSTGNAYVIGRFVEKATFGSRTLVATNLVGASGFAAIFSPNGDLLRVDQLDDNPEGWLTDPSAVALNKQRTIYVTGTTNGPVAPSFLGTLPPLMIPGQPVIVEQPADRTVYRGTDVSFQVVAEGTTPLSYQWFQDDVPIVGAGSAVLHLGTLTNILVASYTVEIKNDLGSVRSRPVTLNVKEVRPLALDLALYPGLTITGEPGFSYDVQYTLSLEAPLWITVTNLTLATGTNIWFDLAAVKQRRFYRAVQK